MKKPHSLLRLSQRVYNTPHLITPAAFNVIVNAFEARSTRGRLDYLDDIVDALEPDDDTADVAMTPPDEPDDDDSKVGVLRVDGSLTYKPLMTMCGEAGTSYQQLVAQTQALADSGKKLIIMELSSPGGEGSHCFQTAQEIRDICDSNGITLIGYADEMACSGGYALISVCDQVIANPSAVLGSIGVVVALMDTSEAYAKAGLKRIFITAGENKVPFAADGSFKQSFLDEVQADVDKMNAEFAAFVSKNTGLSVKTIMDFEAGVFDADVAVEKGLANAVMTHQQFAAYVAQIYQGMQ